MLRGVQDGWTLCRTWPEMISFSAGSDFGVDLGFTMTAQKGGFVRWQGIFGQ